MSCGIMAGEMDSILVIPQFETTPVKGVSTVSPNCSFGRETLQDDRDGIKDPWMHDL